MTETAAQTHGQMHGQNQGMDRRPQAGGGKIVVICLGIVFGMLGLSYAAVPLYEIFCQVTGFGGTTNRAEAGPMAVLDREVTVRFDANMSRELGWDFKPVSGPTTVKVGETGLAFYEARNPTDRPLIGTATFNVTPFEAGAYFSKIECFCFTEQRLEPGQRVDMPVTFFVDPAIADDPKLDGIKTITLSYTFFPMRTASAE